IAIGPRNATDPVGRHAPLRGVSAQRTHKKTQIRSARRPTGSAPSTLRRRRSPGQEPKEQEKMLVAAFWAVDSHSKRNHASPGATPRESFRVKGVVGEVEGIPHVC